jgi:tetratricopeptide (TPR) repeat protein
MADFFVSYTSSDRDWANWIGLELERLGHVARVHECEISAGGNIPLWMEQRHQQADHVLFVISKLSLMKDYSNWERLSAEWAAVSNRPNFGLPVFVEQCETPTLLAPFKRCDLYGLNEEDARTRLAEYLTPPKKPTTAPFPAARPPAIAEKASSMAFPGARSALSNIPISVPRHFLGRDMELHALDVALSDAKGRVAAVHGLRGVGKTTLAAAYAERHKTDYRATWWIRAQTDATMRADLIALGVRLGWVAADEKEEPALNVILERLRDSGERILLIYDNAIDPGVTERYLPRGSAANALVTSNAPAWGKVAEPIKIEVWSKQTGADFLIARTGRTAERPEAEALSDVLGGLPLAHEQATAYCERVGTSFREYQDRFEAEPARLLGGNKDAPAEYHNKLTVAKAFGLAIDEAGKLHPAAEPLIVHAALLAPEPIPLFLFSEGREAFGEPLATQLAGDGLDEAVAALRAFALIDRETILDERDPLIATETIRLHRLVRTVAGARLQGESAEAARRVLITAMAAIYPSEVYSDPSVWPRARRLDALALDLVADSAPLPRGAEVRASVLLAALGDYRFGALVAYAQALPLFQRAVALREEALGPENPSTAESVDGLAQLLQASGDLEGARPLYERALAIWEEKLGPEHPETGTGLNNLGLLFSSSRGSRACPTANRAFTRR